MARIGSLNWQCQRFGIGIQGFRRRLYGSDLPPVLLTSLPKSGTNLAERMLFKIGPYYRTVRRTLLDDNLGPTEIAEEVAGIPRGFFMTAHLPKSEAILKVRQNSDLKVVLMLRDPRDVLLSNAHYIPQDRRHRFRRALAKFDSIEDRLRLLILGDERTGIPGVRWTLERYAGWIDSADCLIRFEDLIGRSGGGDDSRQRAVLGEAATVLGIRLSSAELSDVGSALFDEKSPTFRSGQIRQWVADFPAEAHRLLENKAGDLLAKMGYGHEPATLA